MTSIYRLTYDSLSYNCDNISPCGDVKTLPALKTCLKIIHLFTYI